jgi:glycosyltransferase involved in cell wall biosynthesis
MPESPEISVVVPVYNSERSLEPLIDGLSSALSAVPGGFEVILVDDASRDGSWRVLLSMRERRSRLKILRLERNMGEQIALLCGMSRARGNTIVTMDDDLQNPPEEIPRMHARLMDHGLDVVYGHPAGPSHSALRNLASRCSRLILRLTLPGLNPRFGSFRIFRSRIGRELIARSQGRRLFLDGIVARLGARTGHVDVIHRPREHGSSNYSFAALLGHFLNAAIGYGSNLFFAGAVALPSLAAVGIITAALGTHSHGSGGLAAHLLAVACALPMLAAGGYFTFIRIDVRRRRNCDFEIREEI